MESPPTQKAFSLPAGTIIQTPESEAVEGGPEGSGPDLASTLYDIPEFLPYPYYALATENWSDERVLERVGLHRLEDDHILVLGLARNQLLVQLAQQVAKGDGPITFIPDEMLCSSDYPAKVDVGKKHLDSYTTHADGIKWLSLASRHMSRGFRFRRPSEDEGCHAGLSSLGGKAFRKLHQVTTRSESR